MTPGAARERSGRGAPIPDRRRRLSGMTTEGFVQVACSAPLSFSARRHTTPHDRSSRTQRTRRCGTGEPRTSRRTLILDPRDKPEDDARWTRITPAPPLVIPRLDHGIHADTSRQTKASPRRTTTAWSAGSSPAMTPGAARERLGRGAPIPDRRWRLSGMTTEAIYLPLPPRHPMAGPWDPCRYVAAYERFPEALGNGVECRIRTGNDE